MPTVPGLIPSVAPSEAAIPKLSVSADPNAFGANIGHALGQLGTSVEHVGDELWRRAVAMQEVRNKAEADQADADYMQGSAKLRAEFHSLQGKSAVDAYPKYQKDLTEMRGQLRQGLTTEQSRTFYDSQSRGFLAREIFAGAGHAAQQGKAYAAGASQARVDELTNYSMHNPKDDDAFERATIQAKNEIYTTQAPIRGWGDEQAKHAVDKQISSMWVARIHGLAREAPFEAQKMFDANKDKLFGSDLQHTEDFVRTQRDNVGARVISTEENSISTEDGKQRTMKEVVDAAQEKAKAISDDPIFLRNVENTTIGDYNKRRQVTEDTRRQNVETVSAGIGKGPANITELRKDPAVARAIDALPAKEQNAIPGIIRRYTESAKKEANEANFNALIGKQYTREGREELLSIDPTTQNISQPQVRQVWALQEKIRKQQDGDPRVNRVIGWLRQSSGAQMEALGVFKRTETNKDDYDQFAGSVAAAVDGWQEVHGKPPTQKETVEQIGPALMKQKLNHFWEVWKTDSSAMFKVKPPEDFVQGLRNSELARGNPEPDDFQIARAWRQVQWKKLFKPSVKAGPEDNAE